MSSQRAIGVFDSGLGGLTVLRELTLAMPHEDFIYLGDVARLPYGTKSPGVVTRYSERCLNFLLGQGVKMVVVACNTATANALPQLRRDSPVEVLGVIEPGVRAALAVPQRKRVMVLATSSAVRSEAYPKEFRKWDAQVRVDQVACPLFVPLAEEGWFDHPVTVSVAKEYLQSAEIGKDDVIVMGCTHYPLLEPSLRRVLGERTALVHGGEYLAQEVRASLASRSELNPSMARGKLIFFSTDVIPSGLPLVSQLFGDQTAFGIVDLE